MDRVDPNGDHIAYDLKDDSLLVDRDDCFVLVIWNIEIIICPVFGGEFSLKVDDVPETARGGVVILRQSGNETTSLTDDLRAGVATFSITF